MIVVAGLSPAWQQIMCFDAFHPGEVNRATQVQYCASGKVLNVAVALAHLGADAQTVSLIGGPLRGEIVRQCDSLGVRHHFVETHWATRACTTILDCASGIATELVENAGPITADELLAFKTTYARIAADASVAVLTGSLPQGAPRELFRDLLRVTPCPAILDVRGPELLCALECRPLVVKPNRAELAATFDADLSQDAALRQAVERLHHLGAQWVVVTDGAVPLTAAEPLHCYRIQPPAVEMVNSIGCGDCLAAGLAWGISLKKPLFDALRLGVAAAVQNVTTLLPGRIDPICVERRADILSWESLY